MNLFAKFSRWCHHEQLNASDRDIQTLQCRQHKRCRFSGSCTGLTDTITPSQSNRNEGHLNRAWLFIANFCDCFQSCGCETQLCKCRSFFRRYVQCKFQNLPPTRESFELPCWQLTRTELPQSLSTTGGENGSRGMKSVDLQLYAIFHDPSTLQCDCNPGRL